MIVPQPVWALLAQWYGVQDNSVIQRYMYCDPYRNAEKFFIDLYPGRIYRNLII